MRFATPEWFFALLLFTLIFILWGVFKKRKEKKIQTYFSVENQKRLGLSKKGSFYAHGYRLSLLAFSVFTVLALARPQMGSRQMSQTIEEHSIVYLVDMSRSMLTKDVSPSRLELMKYELKRSLKSLQNVQVGLIAFAGSVDLVSPLTQDVSAIEDYVSSLNPSSMVTQGTEIKTALKESRGYFRRTSSSLEDEDFEKLSKIIVLFSDGEDHQQETVDEVQEMRDLGYNVFTVGVGTESGGYVPESQDEDDYIKDASGQSVLSKPNFDFLKELAQIGGGSFFYLDPRFDLGSKLDAAINKISTQAKSQKDFVVENEIYQVFLVLAALMLPLVVLFRRLK